MVGGLLYRLLEIIFLLGRTRGGIAGRKQWYLNSEINGGQSLLLQSAGDKKTEDMLFDFDE